MLIEIEGIDGAGKTTLTTNLVRYFGGKGKSVLRLKFPDEGETITGKMIRAWLRKEWTTGDELRDAYIHQCLQIVNRLDLLPPVHAVAQYDHIIVDRYYSSTIVYGTMDGLNEGWLKHICARLPKPDISILLDIPVAESFKRKPVREDRYEEKKGYLERVAESYRELFRTDGRRKVIQPLGWTKQQVLEEAVRLIEG